MTDVAQLSHSDKLKAIENEMFSAGRLCKGIFYETSNFLALRASVSAYRCSMQSMRDQRRYNNQPMVTEVSE